MNIDGNALCGIVTEIWESMLALPIESRGDAATQRPEIGRDVYASVQISGGWEGAVVIGCGEGAAVRFTAAMLGVDEGEPTPAEIVDVMGELANMAGGNLKSLLECSTTLSLPTVAVGRDLVLTVPGTSPLVREVFCSAADEFSVVVVARLDRAE